MSVLDMNDCMIRIVNRKISARNVNTCNKSIQKSCTCQKRCTYQSLLEWRTLNPSSPVNCKYYILPHPMIDGRSRRTSILKKMVV